MPMLGFTVFIDKILDGTKTQTIRKMRKTPIKLGDILYLYAYPRTKNTRLLGVTRCIEAFNTTLCVALLSDDTAKADGFNNAKEMREYFKPNIEPDDDIQLIRWSYPLAPTLEGLIVEY